MRSGKMITHEQWNFYDANGYLLLGKLLHASDVNQTDLPRRAFSVCYMDAATRSSKNETFTRVF